LVHLFRFWCHAQRKIWQPWIVFWLNGVNIVNLLWDTIQLVWQVWLVLHRYLVELYMLNSLHFVEFCFVCFFPRQESSLKDWPLHLPTYLPKGGFILP
jgi:hypothetical protein